jgi:hypothetical protein
MDRLCQIALKQKLSCKFKKFSKFSSRVKVKSQKMKLRKMRVTCTVHFYVLIVVLTLMFVALYISPETLIGEFRAQLHSIAPKSCLLQSYIKYI